MLSAIRTHRQKNFVFPTTSFFEAISLKQAVGQTPYQEPRVQEDLDTIISTKICPHFGYQKV